MLLRNIDPANGHCNGTKYVIKQMTENLLDTVVASGKHAGKRLFIQRISLSTDNSYAYIMKGNSFLFALILVLQQIKQKVKH